MSNNEPGRGIFWAPSEGAAAARTTCAAGSGAAGTWAVAVGCGWPMAAAKKARWAASLAASWAGAEPGWSCGGRALGRIEVTGHGYG